MSEMTRKEVIERFNESMKLAASRAREMGVAQNQKAWDVVANQLDEMRKNGMALISAKALSRAAILTEIDRQEEEIRRKTVH